MRRLLACLPLCTLLIGLPCLVTAQLPGPEVLQFATRDSLGGLAGWSGNPAGTVWVDSVVVRSAPYAARLELKPGAASRQSVLLLTLPAGFSGRTLELRGWLRTEGVEGFAGLWLREDGRSGTLQLENMQSRQLSGTTEWTQYTIRLPLERRARSIALGAVVAGTGTVWVDDLELLVDGKPAAEAPRRPLEVTAVDADREFDEGSRIADVVLTRQQVENLALLGRVWGFVKYHHPRVTGGHVHWDYELFRVLPAVLEARDRASAAEAMAAWLEKLGDPPACNPCAAPPTGPHLAADVAWIGDRALVGERLGARLERIHRDRHASGEQYYVSQVAGVGNPDFGNEDTYEGRRDPDAGYRLLALFRLWNVIEYWFPYRDVIGEDWRGVLVEFVPRLMAAATAESYRLELLQLAARMNDTHANLWGELQLRPPTGAAQLPVVVRFVEGRAVVTHTLPVESGTAAPLQRGDVVVSIDGAAIDSLVGAWRPYYAASNEPTRLRDIAASLTRGSAGPARVSVLREGRTLVLDAERVPFGKLDRTVGRTHDLPGETFQRLDEDVAYLKLSSVEAAKSAEYVAQAEGAKVLVIDIRNYPSQFVVFALGGHLVAEPTEFARFTVGDLANPGAFAMGPPLSIQPIEPRFTGRVVILVDETSVSQAEYTAMAFRAAPGAIVVGSTTAGADGNVSPIPLPGGTRALISGIGVFYPDRRPTQRIGIVPDLEVRPTLAGLLAGRDEVLEAGVSRALGRAWRMPAR